MHKIEALIYSVVDIETTGKGIRDNRITEICVIRTDGERILDKFVSLINPRRRVPSFITGLTGIDDDMLRDAPPFEEVAQHIAEITEDAVFVAHNVNFDYPIVRSEFRALGYDFKRRKLCTKQLAKKLMPGKFSYGLGRLCSTLGIPLVNRHRAEGDADATVLLFHRLISLDDNGKVFAAHLDGRKKELAPLVDRKMISGLPQSPGVYYFKDSKEEVIYVGKAVRIKDRVLAHFYRKDDTEHELCRSTATIDYVDTGNELVALLLEAHEIQEHNPKFNVVQKKLRLPYQIVHYVNRKGIVQFGLDRKSALDLGARPFFR
ncbi:MAG: exonuclease domain-containing protein, partial [Pricia sp.]